MATHAFALWGYRTDQWPAWVPLDVGLLEHGYDAGVFWAYLMNTYPLGPGVNWKRIHLRVRPKRGSWCSDE